MWIQSSPHRFEHGLGKVTHFQRQFQVMSTWLHHYNKETEREGSVRWSVMLGTHY